MGIFEREKTIVEPQPGEGRHSAQPLSWVGRFEHRKLGG